MKPGVKAGRRSDDEPSREQKFPDVTTDEEFWGKSARVLGSKRSGSLVLDGSKSISEAFSGAKYIHDVIDVISHPINSPIWWATHLHALSSLETKLASQDHPLRAEL